MYHGPKQATTYNAKEKSKYVSLSQSLFIEDDNENIEYIPPNTRTSPSPPVLPGIDPSRFVSPWLLPQY